MIQPYGKYVLCKYIQKTTPSGLIMPASTIEKDRAIVLRTSNDNRDKFQSGDTVFLKTYNGQIVEHDGQEYLMVHEDMIIGFVR